MLLALVPAKVSLGARLGQGRNLAEFCTDARGVCVCVCVCVRERELKL